MRSQVADLKETNQGADLNKELTDFQKEVLESPLSVPAKTDVTNNICTLLYIIKNLDFIGDATNDWAAADATKHSADDKFYVHSDDKARDKKNGVLRTPDGHSFHINYFSDKQAAIDGFTKQAEQIVSILKSLADPDDRLLFASKFEWPELTGCYEARVAKAVVWALRRIDAITTKPPLSHSLEDIIDICRIRCDAEGGEKEFVDFVVGYCKQKRWESCLAENDKGQFISHLLTRELIKNYAEKIGIIDTTEAEGYSDETKAQYAEYRKRAARVVFGKTRTMIHHCFKTKEEAKAFCSWVKTIKPLLPLIHKASVKFEEGFYIVRLSKAQEKALLLPAPVADSKTQAVSSTSAIENKAAAPEVVYTPVSDVTAVLAVTLERKLTDSQIDELWRILLNEIKTKNYDVLTALRLKELVPADQAALLRKVDANDHSLLHWVASQDESGKACRIYLDAIDVDVLSQAASLKNNNGWLPLHAIARYQPADVCLGYIDKVEPEVLSQTISIQTIGSGLTPLHMIAVFQRALVFISYIEKIDQATNEGLHLQKNDDGETGLHAACRCQSPVAVNALLEIATSDTLNKACSLLTKAGKSVLDYVIYYQQSPMIVASLLSKINDETLKIMLKVPNSPDRLLSIIVDYMNNAFSFQDLALLKRLFALVGIPLTNQCCELYRKGSRLSSGILEIALPHLLTLISEQPELASIEVAWRTQLQARGQVEEKKASEEEALVVPGGELTGSQIDGLWRVLLKEIKTKNYVSTAPTLKRLARADQAALLRKVDANDHSLLHWVASQDESGKACRIYLDAIDVDVLSQAASLKNNNGWLPLHAIARYQPSSILVLYVKKIGQAINEGLHLQKNDDGETGLHAACRYRSSAAVNILLNATTSDALNKTCSLLTKAGESVLEYAVLYQTPAIVAFLLGRLNDETLKIMFKAPSPPADLLSTIANYMKYEGCFQSPALLERLFVLPFFSDLKTLFFADNDLSFGVASPISAYGMIASLPAEHKLIHQRMDMFWKVNSLWEILSHNIQVNDHTKIFEQLEAVASAGQRVLLRKADPSGNLLLHMIARVRRNPLCLDYINKFKGQALTDMAFLKNIDDCLPLHVIAQHQSGDVCLAYINGVDNNALSQTASLKNNIGWTSLHMIVRFQSSDVCLRYINKVEAKALSQATSIQTNQGGTLLHFIACYQSSDVLISYIEKIGSTINEGLHLQLSNSKETGLHLICRYQPSAVNTLLKITTAATLNKTCSLLTKTGQSVLEYAVSYQPAEIIASLLNKIDNETLKIMLKAPNTPKQLLLTIVGYIAHDPSFQDPVLLKRLFDLAGIDLTNFCSRLYFEGKTLSPGVLKSALPHMKALITKCPNHAHDLELLETAWQSQLERAQEEEKKANGSTGISVRLSTGETLMITSEDIVTQDRLTVIVKSLWEKGLKSVEDLHLLMNQFPCSSLAKIIRQLCGANLAYTGCSIPFVTPTHQLDERAQQAVQRFDGLLKIIQPENWNDFKKQINDPTYRPKLRKAIDKTRPLKKFVSLEAKIVDYKHDSSNKKEYKSTKKQAVTLLSPQLNTAVFGEHNPNRPLVGLMFDWRQVKIKAMMGRDTGTYERGWVGEGEEVSRYASRHKDINFTNEEDFRRYVRENPHRLNEVLAKLTKESILAVVIASDTPQARETARQYQQDLKTECGINVPIEFYKRGLRGMLPYTLERQLNDITAKEFNQPNYNFLRACQQKDEPCIQMGLKTLIKAMEGSLSDEQMLNQLFHQGGLALINKLFNQYLPEKQHPAVIKAGLIYLAHFIEQYPDHKDAREMQKILQMIRSPLEQKSEAKTDSNVSISITLKGGRVVELSKESLESKELAKEIWTVGLPPPAFILLSKQFPDSLLAKVAITLQEADFAATGCLVSFEKFDIIVQNKKYKEMRETHELLAQLRAIATKIPLPDTKPQGHHTSIWTKAIPDEINQSVAQKFLDFYREEASVLSDAEFGAFSGVVREIISRLQSLWPNRATSPQPGNLH